VRTRLKIYFQILALIIKSIIIIIIIIYTPTQVHRVTMVGGELKVTTSMYRR